MAALAHNLRKMARKLSRGADPPEPALPAAVPNPGIRNTPGDAAGDAPTPPRDFLRPYWQTKDPSTAFRYAHRRYGDFFNSPNRRRLQPCFSVVYMIPASLRAVAVIAFGDPRCVFFRRKNAPRGLSERWSPLAARRSALEARFAESLSRS